MSLDVKKDRETMADIAVLPGGRQPLRFEHQVVAGYVRVMVS